MQVNNYRIQLSPNSMAQNQTTKAAQIPEENVGRVFLSSFHAPEGTDEALDELENNDSGDSTDGDYFERDPYDPSQLDARAGAEFPIEDDQRPILPSGE